MMASKLSYESASLAVSCLHTLAAPITSDMSIVSAHHSVYSRACNSYTRTDKEPGVGYDELAALQLAVA